MANEPNQQGWIAHSLGRLEGEVKQLNERMGSVEQRLDRLLYAVIGLLGLGLITMFGMLLSLFGVRFGG